MKIFFSLVIGLVTAFVVPSGAWAQAYNIDLSKLPADATYRMHIEQFKPLYKYLAVWSPDWTASIPKAKVVALVENLLNETKSFIAKDKTGNPDLLLFQALLKISLYNADIVKYHDELVGDLKAFESKYPKDYRSFWMLGNHYGSADDPYSAVREYATIFKTGFQGNVEPAVLNDYLKVCFFTFMFSRGKVLMDSVARDNKVSDPKKLFPIYEPMANQLKEPEVKHSYPTDVMYMTENREFEGGFLNRILGIWIPVKDTWKTAAYELGAEGFTSFHILFPAKKVTGENRTSEINIIFQALPQDPFENSIKKVLDTMPDKVEYKQYTSRWPAQVWEYRDRQGSAAGENGHGFVVFVKRAQPQVKGIAIEAPAKIAPGKDGKVATVVVNGGYTRFNGDIYYTFQLNSTEDAFASAKEEFFEFLDRVLLD